MNRIHVRVDLNSHRLVTPGEAWARRGRHLYTHRRSPEDNESAACGAREGAASLNPNEITCPDRQCREEKR